MSFVKRDVKDVVVQYPHRYELRDISTGAAVATYDFVPVTGEVTEAGTDVNRAYLMPIEEGLEDASAKADVAVPNTRTINEKALDADIILTPADVGASPASHAADADIHVTAAGKVDWNNAYGLSRKNLVNLLRMKLQFSLAVQDIDAWCDLFDNANQINSAASSGYMISSGILKKVGLSQLLESDQNLFGMNTWQLAGQVFTMPLNATISAITIKLAKNGSPTDNAVMKIYNTSGGLPTTVAYTSDNSISGGTLTTTYVEHTFNFTGAAISGGVQYAFVLSRSGATSDSNYYLFRFKSSITPGNLLMYNGSWSSQSTNAIYYKIVTEGDGVVVWNANTPTEALEFMAVTANQTPNTGTIAWYLSDDGTNWTQVTALDTIQDFNFDAANVYLKCVLTGDAQVDEVAWGGY